MKTSLFALACALTISWAMTPWARRLAVRAGVIDHPDSRRVHVRPVPRWGGIAIWAGVVAAFFLAAFVDWLLTRNIFITRQILVVLGGATVVALVGLLDDKYELSALWQAVVLIAVSTAAALLGVRVAGVTNPFDEGMLWLGRASIPVTVLWLFGVTKTVDLVDGLDGLAAGVCAISSFALCLLGLMMNQHSVAILCAAVTGASIGFLRYNYPPAQIFMGTVGAQFMGFIIAGSAVIGAFKMAATFAVIVPILALGVPLFDAFFAVARRAASGQPVHMPDRRHIHHRLLDLGLTQAQAILIIYAATFLLSAGALLVVFVVR